MGRKARDSEVLKLPTVPIKALRRRKSANKDVIKEQRKRTSQIRMRSMKRKSQFHRPAYFIATARKESRDKSRIERLNRCKGPVVWNDRLGIVIRISSGDGLSVEALQILHVLKLYSVNNAVFVKVTPSVLELLSIVRPYVMWGYADVTTVRNIILKRGKTKMGSKVRFIDNSVVEEKLGHHGILCIEDIVHELVSLGTHMREVLGFLLPFRIMPPTGGWVRHLQKAQHPFNQLAGNRDEMISELIHKMV